MNDICNGKFLEKRNLMKIVFFITIVFYINVNGQNYPPQEQISDVDYRDYNPPSGDFPEYLEPFTESLSGSTVTRISDRNEFGVSGQRLRHNYSKDQTWNSDGTLIKLAGYPSAILDGETYEFLYWSDIPSYGRWSNTQPNIIYGTSGRSFVSHNVNTNQRTTLRTFNEYNSVDFGYGEGNQDKYDRYVGLIGKRGGSDITLIVYDIQNDVITGTKDIDNAGDLDWFSVSQLGGFAVAQWHANGLGDKQGIKSYNINLENEIDVYATTQHGDLGVDAFGNEVIVEYGNEPEWDEDHSLYMARLDGGGSTLLFPYINGRGIWGGHISTRNLDRPGWAYISEQCCPNNPVAPAEMFAIKLDGSGTIERYGKHNSEPSTYLHETQNVPNRNGTKILFASNWFNDSVSNQDAPPAFVLEYPQNAVGLSVNAGDDVVICQGESITLTATGAGGNMYSWSNGGSSQSINVSPNETTTFTVTLTSSSGIQVTDDITVTVNPLPNANAGDDITINAGESVQLTASGGDTYEWSTGETTQSIEVSPSETTSYSVLVTRNGCSSSDAVTITVDQNVIPVVANAGEDTVICQGESVVLSASGGDSYVWSTGETSQSISVNPNGTTTYTVTVSNGETSDSDDVTVTVNSLPNANAGDNVTIYSGESTTLTASGGNAYEWSTGATTQSIEVSPESTTSYSVIVYQNDCSSSDEVTVFVEDSVVVNANAGDDVAICQGDMVTLTASGGETYLWSTGETTQSIDVYPSSTSTYSVTAYIGESSDTDDVLVTVNPLPVATVSDDVTIEEGQSVTLSVSGGNDYSWNTGSTNQSITVSPSQTTIYSATVYLNDCYDTETVTVTVVPLVNADAGEDVEICSEVETGESSATLVATGGLYYEWSTGETTQSIVVSPSVTTEYQVMVSNGFSQEMDAVNVLVTDCLSVEENEAQVVGLFVYPNPASDIINIKLSGVVLTQTTFSIYDLVGRQVLSGGIGNITNNAAEQIKTLNVSSLPRGVYLMNINFNGRTETKRIILN